MKVPMGPPPLQNPKTKERDPIVHSESVASGDLGSKITIHEETPPENMSDDVTKTDEKHSEGLLDSNPNATSNNNSSSSSRESIKVAVPYVIPPWSGKPCHSYSLEIIKDGSVMDQLDISGKGAYMFGRIDLCDFILEHPTISRFHAVLQFKPSGEAFLYDLGSTHGTLINKNQVKKKVYVDLHVGDVIRFGQSSRLYIFQGPPELMLPEADLERLRNKKLQMEMLDCEASLSRARIQVSMAEGISWGMSEDAIEEDAEDENDEVTWQTYKGQLTEKQQKTRDKIIKRNEKIANMRKEIDSIRAKDIPQGGLTQGQQTQIARNEQRISQIMEELDNLEETLNQSIQESIGAHSGKIFPGRNKRDVEGEDEIASSDDDEFYDRTKKKLPTKKNGDHRQVETADTLLDSKETIQKEMKELTDRLLQENSRLLAKTGEMAEASDTLDAYMTAVSSQLVSDETTKLEKELSSLQSELDRIQYLLKIADPTGEFAEKREKKRSMAVKLTQEDLTDDSKNKGKRAKKKSLDKPTIVPSCESESVECIENKTPKDDKASNENVVNDAIANDDGPLYPISKPKWLGAVEDIEKENPQEESQPISPEQDHFISYKDRKRTLVSEKSESEIEGAAPGLLIRKRKQIKNEEVQDKSILLESMQQSVQGETTAAQAVALLLKHKRGYFVSEEEETYLTKENNGTEHESSREKVKSKRVLGPERPSFLEPGTDYESWVPPEGQTGDGRTSLNDRFGY